MTTTPDETPDEQDPKETKARRHIRTFKGDDGGITLDRMEEIEDAIERGQPLELSAEEQAQYDEAKARFSALFASLNRKMIEPFEPINRRIKDIIEATSPGHAFKVSATDLQKNLEDWTPSDLTPTRFAPTLNASQSLVSDEDLEAITEGVRERDERQEQIRDNTFNTAVAMKEMLDQMEAETTRLKGEAKTANRRWWVLAIVAGLTLLAAAIPATPMVIDWWPW